MRSLKRTVVGSVAASRAVWTGSAAASAGSTAEGAAVGSPGFRSGNLIQIPLHVPIHLRGNSIDIIGLVNPAVSSTYVNAG
jgi:hypothetical protein